MNHLFFKTKQNKLQDKIQGFKTVAQTDTRTSLTSREAPTVAFFLFAAEAAPPEDI